ncbi:ABC transporter permease [Alicyclobacillus fodiniaquatilis]|uniref:ABC transporter permease n=1 Tax=Alicyclobacillus fodiniaquatilis TaxID=1661150 RepID=A0ABW4JSN9_9BACL
MNWLLFIAKRLIQMIITLAIIVGGAFALMKLAPGSFFNANAFSSSTAYTTLFQTQPKLAQHIMDLMDQRYGFTTPIYKQIWGYIWNTLTFQFGYSFEYPSTPIIDTLKTVFPISFILAIGATVFSVVIGIPLGIWAALKRGGWLDTTLTTLAMVFQAIPSYLLAVGIIMLFGVVFPGFLPISGWNSPASAILPMFTLALGGIAGMTMFMRGSLIDTMKQEYIRTAKSKGLSYWSVVMGHAFRNSLTAVITVLGPQIAANVVGTIFVETLFSIPGMGQYMANAFVTDDYPLALTSVFIGTLLILVFNLLVDITYKLLDPRVRLDS